MSRTNSKTARALRESESLLLRKKILKCAGAVGLDTGEVFQSIESSKSSYLDRIATLNSFKNKSKAATKFQYHKAEWIREQYELKRVANNVELDLDKVLEMLILVDPTEVSVQDTMSTMAKQNTDRKQNTDELLTQLQELKDMMRSTVRNMNMTIAANERSNRKAARSAAASSSSSSMNDASMSVSSDATSAEGAQNAWKSAAAIFAEVLIQVKDSHICHWRGMLEEERVLTDDILASRAEITRLLRQDRRHDQNESLKNDFQMEEDDDQEVEMFMNEWMQKIATLDLSHTKCCNSLCDDRLALCNKLNIDSQDRLGGWEEEEHNTFTKVYKRAQMDGLVRAKLIDLLTAQLPDQTPDSILVHEEWYRAVKALAGKKKDFTVEYEATRCNIIESAKVELKAFRESRKSFLVKAKNQQDHEDLRTLLHDKLKELRQSKEAAASENQLEIERLQAVEQARQLELDALNKAESDEKKLRIEEFRQCKALEMAEKQRLLDQQLADQQATLKALIDQNKCHVAQREQQRIDKQDERQRRTEELQAEDVRRLELLMKLAQQVPYYENIQNAVSKLDHVTASAKAHEYIKEDDLGRGYYPMNGFTDKKVISDARFRLASALRAAGVQYSDAARQAVAAYHPRPHLAIHGII